jgi:hypothetical protein
VFYSAPNFCGPSVSVVEGNLIAVAIKPLLVFVGNIICVSVTCIFNLSLLTVMTTEQYLPSPLDHVTVDTIRLF